MILIVEEIERIVARMRSVSTGPPYYYYGHPQQIQRELTAQDKNNTAAPKKYPAVFLKLDTRESVANGVWSFSLNLAIVAFTNKQYRTQERYENVFKPTLYPLYISFLQAIEDDGRFMWQGAQPEHTKIDRPYWGTEAKERNTANSFSDPLDAIEILNLQLTRIDDGCPVYIEPEPAEGGGVLDGQLDLLLA